MSLREVIGATALFCVALIVQSQSSQRVALAIDTDDGAAQLLALTNIARTSNGLPALPRDPRLNQVAAARSADMIRRDYFAHQIPPNGTTVVDLLESLGLRMRSAGENIAWNNALDFTTVQVAGDDFMNSPEHRANVLSSRWDRVGTGVAEGDGKRMYTVVFLQAAPSDEGTARDQPPPRVNEPAGRAAPEGAREIEELVAPQGLIDGIVNRVLRLLLDL